MRGAGAIGLVAESVGLIAFVTIGLLIAGAGGYMWVDQGERMNSYEATEATVLSSSVDVDEGGPEEGTTYSPEITYEYTVDGKTYTSTNVLPGPGQVSKGNRGWAREIVENHPEGATVTAYYDPSDPSTAFLVKERGNTWLFVAGFGVLFALVGASGVVTRAVGIVL